MAATERFLAMHLGGRYQEGGSPEVMQRLEELTVDPASVELAAELDSASLGVPEPAFDLEPGSYRYAVRIEAAGQSLDLTSGIEVEEQEDEWVVTETATTPAGPATDRTVLDKDGLVVARRSISQGPVSIEIEVSEDAVTGEMNVSGQPMPINVPLDGP